MTRVEPAEVLVDDAVAAELATGVREPTRAAALTSVAARVARMSAGGALLVVGILMLVLPGPGVAVVLAGLLLLARDVTWAARLADRLRDRLEVVPEGARRPLLLVGLIGVLVASMITAGVVL